MHDYKYGSGGGRKRQVTHSSIATSCGLEQNTGPTRRHITRAPTCYETTCQKLRPQVGGPTSLTSTITTQHADDNLLGMST